MDKKDEIIESCNCNIIYEETVLRVKDLLPKDEVLYDLAAVLEISQSAVSHQLRTVKASRLVKFRRDGKVVYYSLDDEHIKTIFNQGFEHITE